MSRTWRCATAGCSRRTASSSSSRRSPSRTARSVADPEIIFRGVPFLDDADGVVEELREAVNDSLEDSAPRRHHRDLADPAAPPRRPRGVRLQAAQAPADGAAGRRRGLTAATRFFGIALKPGSLRPRRRVPGHASAPASDGFGLRVVARPSTRAEVDAVERVSWFAGRYDLDPAVVVDEHDRVLVGLVDGPLAGSARRRRAVAGREGESVPSCAAGCPADARCRSSPSSSRRPGHPLQEEASKPFWNAASAPTPISRTGRLRRLGERRLGTRRRAWRRRAPGRASTRRRRRR